jgi:hypothetical protein
MDMPDCLLAVMRTLAGHSCLKSTAPLCYRHLMVSLQRKGGVTYEQPAPAVAPALRLKSEQLLLLLIGMDIPRHAS